MPERTYGGPSRRSTSPSPPDPVPGRAGASARKQAERLTRRRSEAQLKRSRTARFLRLFAGPSAPERQLSMEIQNWENGAEGEELLARTLERECPAAQLIHDRRIPRSAANIDHIAFAPSGIYVIDAKRYRGRIQVEHPLFSAPKLRIGGRDRTTLVRGLEKQVALVRNAIAPLAGDVPVHGCFCFIAPRSGEVGLPLLRTLRIEGFPLLRAGRLVRLLNSAGSVSPERARMLRNEICARLPPATGLHRA